MTETSWSMAFSGISPDNEASKEAFEKLFEETLTKVRAMSQPMNCNGQFYGRFENGDVNLHQDDFPVKPVATPTTKTTPTTTTGKVTK